MPVTSQEHNPAVDAAPRAGDPSALLRLLQLVSPALPVGAFCYSQGLETAVGEHWVHDERTALAWIDGVLCGSVAYTDMPVLLRLHRAWSNHHVMLVRQWSDWLWACRETAELRAEDRQMAAALARLLAQLGMSEAVAWQNEPRAVYAAMFALAAARWGIDEATALLGYAWSWAENQVMAAVKLVPLGQTAGQRMLSALQIRMAEAAQRAMTIADHDIGRLAPVWALSGAWHETQYCRLYRS